MRISDWSSDVCSSDLFGQSQREIDGEPLGTGERGIPEILEDRFAAVVDPGETIEQVALDVVAIALRGLADIGPESGLFLRGLLGKIGRASCRERVCQYV